MFVLGMVPEYFYSFWYKVRAWACLGAKPLDAATLQYIEERFTQLKNARELHQLTDGAIRQVAEFIETQVLTSDKLHFKKSYQTASRTLFYQKNSAVFLLNNDKKEEGAISKRVCSAVRIPINRLGICQRVVQSVNLSDERSYRMISDELGVFTRLQAELALTKKVVSFEYANKKSAIFRDYEYTSILYTPPELLIDPHGVHDVEKAQVWSLGMWLYTCYMFKTPIWSNLAKKCSDGTLESRIGLHKELVECLKGFSQSTTRDPYHQLIYQMMHAEPQMRPSFEQALKYIAERNPEVDALAKKLGEAFGRQLELKSALEVSCALTAIKMLYLSNKPVNQALESFFAMAVFSRIAIKPSNLLAYMIAKELPTLGAGLCYLLKNASLDECWLKELLPSEQEGVLTARVYEAIRGLSQQMPERLARLENIFNRLSKSVRGISPADCLSISIFASDIANIPQGYIQGSKYGLSYDMQYDGDCLYIRARDNKIYGAYKRVISGLALSLKRGGSVNPVVFNVNRAFRKTKFNFDWVQGRLSKFELELAQQLQLFDAEPRGQGIWPILHTTTFTKVHIITTDYSISIPKISAIAPMGLTLERLFEQHVTFADLLKITRMMAIGLAKLHDRGLIHGDLDSANVLCSIQPFFVGLNDFGFLTKFEGVEQKSLPGAFCEGFYGKIFATAPEFLGNNAFTGDYKAVEMWAFAYMICLLLDKDGLPWDGVVLPYVENLTAMQKDARIELLPVSQDAITKMKSLVQKFIDKHATNDASFDMRFKRLLVSCFQLTPKKRPTIHQFLREVETIQREAKLI